MAEIYFSGVIERIIFENPSHFYKIILLAINDNNADFEEDDIIVTGTIADVFEGQEYRFYGQLVTHPKYGQQLQVSRYERAKPTLAGLLNYFSSAHFKGIGKKTAEKIIMLYDSDDVIDHILAEPEKLTQITGLSSKHRQNFLDKLRFNYGREMILSKLAEYGISNKLAFRIQEQYKEKTLDIIQENPYQLVEDIQGVGFVIADKIAESLGIESHAPQRLRAALLFSLLNHSLETGDTYIEARDLLGNTLEILEKARNVELDPATLAQELTRLIDENKVQQIETKIFDNSLFFSEQGIQKNLVRLLEKSTVKTFPRKQVESTIEKLQEETGITYDNIQKEAIIQAINNPLFILTGGPGTGKTTVINGIIAVYAILHKIDVQKRGECPILLAAPTGRAARRMNELTGLPSATIHRHLGLTEDEIAPSRDDFLDAELVIVDEFSMVDTWLAHQLFNHISSNSQILLVGDADQLPSVNPGQVLADLLQVSDFPSIRLETIYRQSENSTIVTLANQIRQGSLPVDFTEKKADRSYFEVENEQIPATVERIVSAAIKSGISASEVQILAPMYRGVAGIDRLNVMMQALLNPLAKHAIEFQHNGQIFRQGDRIIHLVNDAESNVFNGDLGYITNLLPAKYSDSKQDEVTVSFDENEISYPRNEWYKITLAYALSIHKSQGSEFQVVVLPITASSQRMLQRNLVYTAITRAKSKLILLGQVRAFDIAVKNTGTSRKTYLVPRFTNQRAKRDETISTPQPVDFRLTKQNILTIDPMIGIREEDITQFFKK